MSEELLRIDKLPKLAELRFLLMDILGQGKAVEWYDLSDLCRSNGVNLGFSFESGVKLLQEIALVDIDEGKRVSSKLAPARKEELRGDTAFCMYVTTLLIDQLEKDGILPMLFNPETVKFDLKNHSITLNVSLISLQYPLMKTYLLNMGIAVPHKDFRSKILIKNIYYPFFTEEVLDRVEVFKDGESDIVITKENGIEPEIRLTSSARSIKIFLSYARADEHYKNELRKHFSGLEGQGVITSWHDRLILPGEDWDATIKKNLEEADVIFFLMSSDLMSSGYVNKVEVKIAMDRHDQRLTRIIPIIVRPCDLGSSLLSRFQALPTDARAIASWPNHDEAYVDIVKGFKRLLAI
jgi:hypothetical protein